jgi:hypothetical protein
VVIGEDEPRAILRAKEDEMAELCEHQKQSGTWTVEVRPPNHTCIFCHVDRIESLLQECRDVLDQAAANAADCTSATPRDPVSYEVLTGMVKRIEAAL